MEHYPIEQCYGCLHRQVCKHIPVIEKAMKLKDKLPLYIEEDCDDYVSEHVLDKGTSVKQSASDLTKEVLNAVKSTIDNKPHGIRNHVTMIPAGETNVLRQVIECVFDALSNGHTVNTVYVNKQMMEEIAEECQIDLSNGPIGKIMVADVMISLKVDDTLDYTVVAIE